MASNFCFRSGFVVYSPSRYTTRRSSWHRHTIDLCYTGLDAAGRFLDDPLLGGSIVRQARGPECGSIAPNGPSTPRAARVAFDDPRSPFNGCRREVTFATSAVRNGGGTATIWYTDAYGRAARPGVVSGALKQYVSALIRRRRVLSSRPRRSAGTRPTVPLEPAFSTQLSRH